MCKASDIQKPIREIFVRSVHRFVVLLTAATLAACDNASEEDVAQNLPPEGYWAHMSDLNTPHQYHNGVVADGKIFAVGGSQPLTRAPAEFEQYDPATNRWTILPNMPTPRVFLGAAAVQNRIYTIGGIGDSLHHDATVEVYDLVKQYLE